MRIFKSISGFQKDPQKPLVLALGNFDGIHRGHQKLLNYVVEQARKLKCCPAVFTFQKHPQAILHPFQVPENLQSLDQKLSFFSSHGIKVCFLQAFDKDFSGLSAENFVKKILVGKLGIREICVGHNARFGHGRAGDADLLRRLGKDLGFHVFQATPVLYRGAPISSTATRDAIRTGKIKWVTGFLGRSWSIEGRVVKGSARGKKLGFPTANIQADGYVQPAYGVYAVRARIIRSSESVGVKSTSLHKGVANFGLRPTFGGASKPILETHLFNANQNLYGQKLEVFFVKRLRSEKKFSSLAMLKKQIQKDVRAAKLALK